MSSCCSRTCSSGCGSCRSAVISNVIFTGVDDDTFTLVAPVPPALTTHTVLPSQLFSVNCYTNVTIMFAGTIYYAASALSLPPTAVLTLTLQYYNVAAPGLVNKVAVPLQALVVGSATVDDVIPFTAVQTALLSTGTYNAQLVVSSGVGVPVLTVNGSLSVFMVRKSA
jgi:hypothetical protein